MSAVVLGVGGVTLAATAQGEEITGEPAPAASASAPPAGPITSTTAPPPAAPGTTPTTSTPAVPATTTPGPAPTTSTSAASSGPTAPATLPPGPNQPPSGGYTYSSFYLWPGQTLVLVQNYLEDDRTPVADLTQTVDWGDGTVNVVDGSAVRIGHRYQKLGTYGVRVILHDGAAASLGKIMRDTLVVDDYMGRLELGATSGWVGKPMAVSQYNFSGARTLRISWGDGAVTTVPASVRPTPVAHVYAKAGAYAITAVPANASGVALPRETYKVTIKNDGVKPTAALKKPAAPAKGKSWATVRGTASDAASGVRNVAFTVIEKRGAVWYHWTGSGWKKSAGLAAATKAAKVLTLTPTAAGAWSTKLTGVQKGTLRFTWSALDRAGNRSVGKTLDQKITS